jgi:hypothetical protein
MKKGKTCFVTQFYFLNGADGNTFSRHFFGWFSYRDWPTEWYPDTWGWWQFG